MIEFSQEWKQACEVRPASLSEMGFQYQTLQTSDGGIAYVDTGGTGFAVILIHGNSCSSELFRNQLAAFRGQYRMIAIDLPGHGKSDDAKDPDATYTIPGYAKILNEVVGSLGLDRFAVIGISLGGNIALQWSQLSSSIQGIMLVCSAPMKYSEEAYEAYPPFEGSHGGWPDQLTESQAKQHMRGCGYHVEDPSVRFVIEDAMRTDGKARAKMVASVLAGRGVDETEIVGRLPIPFALVVGREDSALDMDYLAKLPYQNLWRGKIDFIPDAKHAIVVDQVEPFHRLLRDFLEDIKKKG